MPLKVAVVRYAAVAALARHVAALARQATAATRRVEAAAVTRHAEAAAARHAEERRRVAPGSQRQAAAVDAHARSPAPGAVRVVRQANVRLAVLIHEAGAPRREAAGSAARAQQALSTLARPRPAARAALVWRPCPVLRAWQEESLTLAGPRAEQRALREVASPTQAPLAWNWMATDGRVKVLPFQSALPASSCLAMRAAAFVLVAARHRWRPAGGLHSGSERRKLAIRCWPRERLLGPAGRLVPEL